MTGFLYILCTAPSSPDESIPIFLSNQENVRITKVNPMIYIEKTIHLLFAFCLLAFAALQFNDPDPAVWIIFYTLCAAVPMLALLNRPIGPVFWIALFLCVINLGLYATGAYNYYLHRNQEPLMQSMNPEKPYIEEAREFLGVFIALVLIVVSYLLARYRIKKRS